MFEQSLYCWHWSWEIIYQCTHTYDTLVRLKSNKRQALLNTKINHICLAWPTIYGWIVNTYTFLVTAWLRQFHTLLYLIANINEIYVCSRQTDRTHEFHKCRKVKEQLLQTDIVSKIYKNCINLNSYLCWKSNQDFFAWTESKAE